MNYDVKGRSNLHVPASRSGAKKLRGTPLYPTLLSQQRDSCKQIRGFAYFTEGNVQSYSRVSRAARQQRTIAGTYELIRPIHGHVVPIPEFVSVQIYFFRVEAGCTGGTSVSRWLACRSAVSNRPGFTQECGKTAKCASVFIEASQNAEKRYIRE